MSQLFIISPSFCDVQDLRSSLFLCKYIRSQLRRHLYLYIYMHRDPSCTSPHCSHTYVHAYIFTSPMFTHICPCTYFHIYQFGLLIHIMSIFALIYACYRRVPERFSFALANRGLMMHGRKSWTLRY